MKALAAFRWLFAVAALVTLNGCFMTWSGDHYEYRYRVFQARELMAGEIEGPIATETLAQRYLPPAEVGRAMDSLTREGFKLWKIQKVADTPYYTFILRRPVAGQMRPMRAPTEYAGVYQVQEPADTTNFYAFQPTYYGYTVVRFHGAADPLVIESRWDGDKLECNQGDTHHIFIMSGDGLAITHTEERLLADRIERKVYFARRVQTGQP